MCALESSNILLIVHTSCYLTLQHHNSYNRTENYRQWNAVWPPDDRRKATRNMLRNSWLPINHYLLRLVGLTFIYLSKIHRHSNINLTAILCGYLPNTLTTYVHTTIRLFDDCATLLRGFLPYRRHFLSGLPRQQSHVKRIEKMIPRYPTEPPVGRRGEDECLPTTSFLDVSFHSTLNDSSLLQKRNRVTGIGDQRFSKMNHVTATRPTEDW